MIVGDKIFGKMIYEIKPYYGRYHQWFNCVVVIQSNTKSGRIEMAYNSNNFIYDKYEN